MRPGAGAVTLQEIHEQPAVLTRLIAHQTETIVPLARRLRRRRPATIVLAARGSSDNAALYGRYLIETMLRIPVSLAAPSVATMYGSTLVLRNTLVIGLSQSGESPDIVAFLRMARRGGALTVAVTNQPRSPMARAADEVLPLRAGVERSIAATKTYTAQLTALSLLVAAASGDGALLRAHEALPDLVSQALREGAVERWLSDLGSLDRCLVTSRGYNFATAREAALKLKETARIAAEALSSADLLHGPIALVERAFPVLVFAPPGAVAAHLQDVLARLRRRRGIAVVVSSEPALLRRSGYPVPLPAVDERLSPHLYIVPAQLLAHRLALLRGIDPDRPPGLRKVTRVL